MNRSPHLRAVRRAQRVRGFTLIELMITVAIVALLAAIALPAYQDSVWKGKRGEGKAAIMKTLQAEERYYTNNNTYVAYSGTAPSGAFPTFSADSATNSRYTISTQAGPVTAKASNGGAITLCSTGTIAQCVVVKALVNGSADPKCGNALYSDSIGNKGVDSAATKPGACWS